jgi:hypothetical protein
MRTVRYFVAQAVACLLACSSAAASHMVTGNGFGFAVVSPESGAITKFYAHPYSFLHPDPAHPLSEGIEVTNFINQLAWSGGTPANASADYQDDSHLIRIHRKDGEGLCFMPFGFVHPAVIINWRPATEEATRGGWVVEWAHPVSSQKQVHVTNIEMYLLTFAGTTDSMLAIPLIRRSNSSNRSQDLLSASPAWALIALEDASEWHSTAQEFARWRAGLAPQALGKREI